MPHASCAAGDPWQLVRLGAASDGRGCGGAGNHWVRVRWSRAGIASDGSRDRAQPPVKELWPHHHARPCRPNARHLSAPGNESGRSYTTYLGAKSLARVVDAVGTTSEVAQAPGGASISVRRWHVAANSAIRVRPPLSIPKSQFGFSGASTPRIMALMRGLCCAGQLVVEDQERPPRPR